ncbi:hypothetical protein EsH8_V_000385 [Colletotrichum jinshuiense]
MHTQIPTLTLLALALSATSALALPAWATPFNSHDLAHREEATSAISATGPWSLRHRSLDSVGNLFWTRSVDDDEKEFSIEELGETEKQKLFEDFPDAFVEYLARKAATISDEGKKGDKAALVEEVVPAIEMTHVLPPGPPTTEDV